MAYANWNVSNDAQRERRRHVGQRVALLAAGLMFVITSIIDHLRENGIFNEFVAHVGVKVHLLFARLQLKIPKVRPTNL